MSSNITHAEQHDFDFDNYSCDECGLNAFECECPAVDDCPLHGEQLVIAGGTAVDFGGEYLCWSELACGCNVTG